MARVLALVPDLLFGSRLQGALTAAGQEVELIGDEDRLRERLADADADAENDTDAGAAPAAVLIVDLTDQDLDGAGILESLSGQGLLEGIRTLGFYSHVDSGTRERAEQAGFDQVVPRSRMARESGELVTRLVATV
jgi:hypothetical protein